MALPIKIKEWLNARGITDNVLISNGIDWNGSSIVIPIKDPNGNFLFNKYRRDPFGPEEGPKYRYDTGGTSQLFNAHKIKDTSIVVLTEGELDSMRLEVEGIACATSTGGAGTFKDEWLDLFAGKEVYVCFDNDDAGIKGALNILRKMPANLIMIPRSDGIKDITDYLQHASLTFANLLLTAERFPYLSEKLPAVMTMAQLKAQEKKFNNHITEIQEWMRIAKFHSRPSRHYEAIIQLLLNAKGNLRRELRRAQMKDRPAGDNQKLGNDMARAKQVPLESLYPDKLTKNGNRLTGRCPFHNEKTGSFTIFLDRNRFHCFGCDAGHDPIDYLMRRDNCDFVTAVKTLLKK